MNHWALIILKIVSFHDLSLRTPLAGRAANSWPKQLWEKKNCGGRHFSKLWWEGSMYPYVMWEISTIMYNWSPPKQKTPDNFKLFKKAKIWRLISQIWLMIFQISAGLSVSYSSIWKSWNCQFFWLWFKMFWCAIHTPVLHIYIYWRNFISGCNFKKPTTFEVSYLSHQNFYLCLEVESSMKYFLKKKLV